MPGEDLILFGGDDGFEAGLIGDDGGEDVIVYDEAGILEMVIPAAIASGMARQGLGAPIPSGRTVRRIPSGGGFAKRAARMIHTLFTRVGKIEALLQVLVGRVQGVQAGVANAIDLIPRSPGVASPENKTGARVLAGTTTAFAAPAVAGLTAQINTTISPSNALLVSHLVVDVFEDTFGGVAAGQVVLSSTPFMVSALTLAGENLLRSTAPATPGIMFGINGGAYGYPLAEGRVVELPASTPNVFGVNISPRSQAGVNPGDIVGAFLSPGLGN